MKALVVGGGIGGLAAAIALARDGHEVTVLEKAERFAPIGAGIVLAPNALSVLSSLGVDLSARGHVLAFMEVVDAHGTLLQRIDTTRFVGRYGPTRSFLRPDLHEALLDAVPMSVPLHTSATVTSLVEKRDRVEVTWRGTRGEEQGGFDVVVGADGIHSSVRTLVLGELPLRYSGVTCWRGIVDGFPLPGAVEAWGGASRVGLVPLRGDRLYYFLVRRAPRRAPAPAWPDELRTAFAGFSGPAGRLVKALTERPPLHHDIEELEPPVWGQGRVLLLGDAAHAMTPNQGQGAAMAIEDAAVLATVLREGVLGALTRYTAERRARVRRIQLASRRIGELAHWEHPLACALRDGLLRALPLSLSDAPFRRLIEPGFALAQRARAR